MKPFIIILLAAIAVATLALLSVSTDGTEGTIYTMVGLIIAACTGVYMQYLSNKGEAGF